MSAKKILAVFAALIIHSAELCSQNKPAELAAPSLTFSVTPESVASVTTGSVASVPSGSVASVPLKLVASDTSGSVDSVEPDVLTTTVKHLSTVLWTVCCLSNQNNFVYNCVKRTSEDAANPTLNCASTTDRQIIYLNCLENAEPCRMKSLPNLSLINGQQTYKITDKGSIEIVIMQNRVSRKNFFGRSREAMRNVLTDDTYPNIGDNNYWIGLDNMYDLSLIQSRKNLIIYINSSQIFNVQYLSFQISGNDGNYSMNIGRYVGKNANLNNFQISKYSPISQSFKGISEFGNGFCSWYHLGAPSSWWYRVVTENGINVLCSDSVLTTDDGTLGWANTTISGAMMTVQILKP